MIIGQWIVTTKFQLQKKHVNHVNPFVSELSFFISYRKKNKASGLINLRPEISIVLTWKCKGLFFDRNKRLI